jgi:hypothetical protein
LRTFIMAQVEGQKNGQQVEVSKDYRYPNHVRVGQYSINLSDLEEALEQHGINLSKVRAYKGKSEGLPSVDSLDEPEFQCKECRCPPKCVCCRDECVCSKPLYANDGIDV